MKLNINSDFTKLPHATAVLHAHDASSAAADTITLAHDERHLRRKVLTTQTGQRVFVDLLSPVHLAAGDRLVLEDGTQIAVAAAEEELMEVAVDDAVALAELAWHIGNRHLAAQIEANRIVLLRDHVIRDMLHGLGAHVRDVVEPFQPVAGAYAGHDHGHQHHGHHHHGGDGDRDAFGRAPGDPHYGHNHA